MILLQNPRGIEVVVVVIRSCSNRTPRLASRSQHAERHTGLQLHRLDAANLLQIRHIAFMRILQPPPIQKRRTSVFALRRSPVPALKSLGFQPGFIARELCGQYPPGRRRFDGQRVPTCTCCGSKCWRYRRASNSKRGFQYPVTCDSVQRVASHRLLQNMLFILIWCRPVNLNLLPASCRL